MSSTAIAIVSGAAALGGSAVTGLIASKGVKRTLGANSVDLAARLTHERCVAREERDQERRERAYMPILKYVNWLEYFLMIRVRVVTHEMLGTGAGPTSEERRVLDAGPTAEERSATFALVTAVASDEVLNTFDAILKHQRTLLGKLDEARTASERGPAKTGTVDLTASAALQQAAATVKELREARERITKLIRADLNPGSVRRSRPKSYACHRRHGGAHRRLCDSRLVNGRAPVEAGCSTTPRISGSNC